LKAEQKHRVMECNCQCGPDFHNIGIYDNCNSNTQSYTYRFGDSYTNDPEADQDTFFTGPIMRLYFRSFLIVHCRWMQVNLII
jgi:hypothetical protein